VIIFLILGGLSGNLIITILRFGDWDIYARFSNQPLIFFFLVFPYIWLILFIVFAILLYRGLKRFRYAYRHHLVVIFSSAIIMVIALSIFLSFSSLGNSIENYLADNFLAYAKVNNMRSVWSSPEKGLFSGEIKNYNPPILDILDFTGKSWQININKAIIGEMVDLEVGQKVKIIGQKTSDNSISADELRPWRCSCPHCQKNPEQQCSGNCTQTTCSGMSNMTSCEGERK